MEHHMIDIHMHIIPGVDDGSFTLDMSKYMLMMAHIQGVRSIFATPHSFAFLCGQELVWRNYQALREQVEASPFQQRLFLGCEVRCEPENMKNTLEHLKTGRFPAMNGTNCVLTEFSTSVQPQAAKKMIAQLQMDGWRPVIAHAERYPALFQDDSMERLAEEGCLLQINAYSLEEEADQAVSERARRLLAEKVVSFLGSDAHRLDHRPPSVKSGLKYLYEHCTQEYADAVAFANAEACLIVNRK